MTTSGWRSPCIAAVVGIFALSYFLPACWWGSGHSETRIDGWGACMLAAYCVWCGCNKGLLTLEFLQIVIGWSPNFFFPIRYSLFPPRRNGSAMFLSLATFIC